MKGCNCEMSHDETYNKYIYIYSTVTVLKVIKLKKLV